MELDILFVNKERSSNEIAVVLVRYHQLVIRCKLVVGFNEKTKERYYYLLMPFIRLMGKKGDKKGIVRVNVVNWPNEKISKEFQDKCLSILKLKYPDLFTQSEGEVKEYQKEKFQNVLKKRSAAVRNTLKKKNPEQVGAG